MTVTHVQLGKRHTAEEGRTDSWRRQMSRAPETWQRVSSPASFTDSPAPPSSIQPLSVFLDSPGSFHFYLLILAEP